MLNMNDYSVLFNILKLSKKGIGISKLKGATINDISENMTVTDITIRKCADRLVEHGFIEPAIKQGKSKTYYITQKGIKELASVNQNEI